MKFGSGQGFMIGGGVVILILVIIVIVLGTKKSDSPVCPAVGSCPAGERCPAVGKCPAGDRCPAVGSCPAGEECPAAGSCPAEKGCPTCDFDSAPINIAWGVGNDLTQTDFLKTWFPGAEPPYAYAPEGVKQTNPHGWVAPKGRGRKSSTDGQIQNKSNLAGALGHGAYPLGSEGKDWDTSTPDGCDKWCKKQDPCDKGKVPRGTCYSKLIAGEGETPTCHCRLCPKDGGPVVGLVKTWTGNKLK